MDRTASLRPDTVSRLPASPGAAAPEPGAGPVPAARPAAATLAFLVLVLLQAAAVWIPRYFPSQDGPSHLETAVALAAYPQSDLYRSVFEINAGPVPNWVTHAFLAAMTFVVSPLLAERILVTLYAVLFPLAALYFFDAARPGRRLFAFLFLPFVLGVNLHMGFYNFCLGTIVYLVAVGFWWKHRDAFTWARALLLDALLVLGFFCHVLPTLLAIGSIGFLALVDADRGNIRARLRLVPRLAPALVLPAWYLLWVSAGTYPGDNPDVTFALLVKWFFAIESLVTDSAHFWVTVPLALILGLLGVSKIVSSAREGADRLGLARFGRTPGSAFAALAVLLVLIYFLSPDATAGGGFIKQRLAVFPLLVLVPALDHRLAPAARRTFAVVVVVLLPVQLGITLRYYREGTRELEEFNSGIGHVERGRTLLNLPFRFRTDHGRPGIFGHAGGYYASATGGIDLGNYQFATDHFPLRIRPTTPWHPYDPWFKLVPRADYILLWGMPAVFEPLLERLESHAPIFRSEGGRLLLLGRKE